jgi:hypothetical protein
MIVDALEFVNHVEGVELDRLQPMTTLLVWTWNSLYRVIIAQGSYVLVEGGSLFPELTPAHIEGAGTGGSPLTAGWIGVGFLLEFRVEGRRVITSPVVAISTERPGTTVIQ